MLLAAADYLAVANIAYAEPLHPGDNSTHAPGATAAQITETNRLYASNLLQYSTHHTVKNHRKEMLLEAVPDTFTQILEDQRFGYAQLTTLQLLTHLDTTYGEVTNEDLANNLEQMNAPWDPTTPIEDLWTQISKAKNYAAADNAISDTTALLAAALNLTNTGLFQQGFEQWRGKTKAEQMYAAFMKHFGQANINRLLSKTTSKVSYSAKEQPKAPTKRTKSPATKKQ
jgi:hypothetical protein